MSVYRPRRKDGSYKSRIFLYDFVLKPKGGTESVRFHGSTGQTGKAAALRVEKDYRELAAKGELSSMMTMVDACWKYWNEVAQHKPSADDLATWLEYIKRLIGGATLVKDITPDMVATAAARRAAEPIMVRKKVDGVVKPVPTGKLVSLSTVNRQITQLLRRVLRRARKVWKVPIDLDVFEWDTLLYKEPAERVREMTSHEAEGFWQRLRADYHPIVRYYLLSGKRRSEVIGILKFDVDLPAMKIRYNIRKRNGITKVSKSLTRAQAQILREEMAKHNHEHVFTYIAQREPDKGMRKPITAAGLKTEIVRTLKAVGIVDFHPNHDLRHTFGTGLLRASGGNYELVRKALDHTDIKTTQKYAHVLDEDVVAGIEALEASRTYPGVAIGSVGRPAEKK